MNSGGARIAAVAGGLAILVAILEIAYGASAGDVLLYLGYELAFVVVPGCLLVAVLRPDLRGTLTGLAIGWAAGYALEVLAFDLTAALSIRDVFSVYPLLVAVPALLLLRRGEAVRAKLPALTSRDLALFAAVCGLAVLYVGISLFANTRLPGDGSVIFNQDASWSIALSADLVNHFPLSDPNVSGQPLPYHYFVNAHMAAASQVTGIDVPLIFLRLYALPLIACIVLVFAAAGQRLFASASTGTLAGGLTMLVGEIQLDPRLLQVGQLIFIGALFTLLLASPSFVFGMVIFLALVVLLAERLAEEGGTPGEWALVTLLAVGATGAKVTILPLLAVALALYGGIELVRHRRIPRRVLIAAAIVVVVELAVYVSQYRGHSSGVVLDFTAGYDFIQNFPGVRTLEEGITDVLPGLPGLDALLDVAAIPVGLIGLFGAQLVGIWLYLRRRPTTLPSHALWLLCLLAGAILGLAVLSDPDANNQLYFVFYGTVAASLLAAAGIADSWRAAERPARRDVARLVAGFLVALIALVGLTLLISGVGDGYPTPRLFWAWYGGLVALLIAVWLIARSRSTSRGIAGLAVCICIVLTGVIDAPVDRVIPSLKDRPAATDARVGLTPGLNDALVWVKDDTDTDAILANSNPGPLSFDYSAFSERRQFLGGWAYSTESREAGFQAVSTGSINPFEDRFAVNTAAFAGDPSALDALRDAGVDYLFVDRVNGPLATAELPPDLEAAGQVVFENEDALVVELSEPPSE